MLAAVDRRYALHIMCAVYQSTLDRTYLHFLLFSELFVLQSEKNKTVQFMRGIYNFPGFSKCKIRKVCNLPRKCLVRVDDLQRQTAGKVVQSRLAFPDNVYLWTSKGYFGTEQWPFMSTRRFRALKNSHRKALCLTSIHWHTRLLLIDAVISSYIRTDLFWWSHLKGRLTNY